jgi:transposase-like protein
MTPAIFISVVTMTRKKIHKTGSLTPAERAKKFTSSGSFKKGYDPRRGRKGLDRRQKQALMSNPRCPTCGEVTRRLGTARGKQRYQCKGQCGAFLESYDHQPSAYPWCVACRRLMKKAGKPRGFQNYQCPQCKTFYLDGARIAQRQRRRRYLASLRWEEAFEVIRHALANVPPDLREEIMQEMMLAALDGRFDLSDIKSMIPFYRRKVMRQTADRFRFVSLDQPIPNTEGLTYADALAG